MDGTANVFREVVGGKPTLIHMCANTGVMHYLSDGDSWRSKRLTCRVWMRALECDLGFKEPAPRLVGAALGLGPNH